MKSDRFFSVAIVLVLGTAYLLTLLPGVGGFGDTAKFQFVGHVLGTPHATGFPTYVLLNYVFTTLFPLGSLAYKANLLSALFSVITSVVLFRTLRLLNLSQWTSFLSTLTFAFSFTFWWHSLQANVYTLHVVFAITTVFFFLHWHRTGKERSFYWGSFFYALSFGNHLMGITLLPAIVYLVWATDRKIFWDAKKIGFILAVVLLSASQYLYFLWRWNTPETSYLEMQTPDLKSLWWYLSGAQFKGQFFAYTLNEIIFERLPLFLKLCFQQFYLFFPISLLGLFLIKSRKVTVFLLLALLGNLFFGLNYQRFDISPYFLVSFLILTVFLAYFLEWVKDSYLPRWLALALLAVIPLSLLVGNYTQVDQSKNTANATAVENILKKIGQDAVIIPADFTQHEYFLYYLIGEGLEKKNLYAFNPDEFSLESIQSYARGEKPLQIPLKRTTAPLGMKLYVMSPVHRDLLERFGIRFQQEDADLYRILK